jgi:ParB family chromosome partitioning protein
MTTCAVTDGHLLYINLDAIVIPADRQRRDLGDLSDLKASIIQVGVLNPIIVKEIEIDGQPTGRFELIAGERRYTAMRQLGRRGIPARLFKNLTEREQAVVELEENIKRRALDWQDEAAAIWRYHNLRIEAGAKVEDVLRELSITSTHLSRVRAFCTVVANEPSIAQATTLSAAANVAKRITERKAAAVLEDLLGPKAETDEASEAATPPFPGSVLAIDFREWAASYRGPRFNLIHCDFPYGLNMDTARLQTTPTEAYDADGSRYPDSEELYFSLLEAFLTHKDNFLAASAHIIFWFSMKHYDRTLALLRPHFRIDPFPLIWGKSDNSGLLPDPTRGPRRCYETALLMSAGDRKILRAKSNITWQPKPDGEHLSVKPVSVVTHFMEMLCDASSKVLDPTCGTGSALEAAINLGAAEVCGLDINPNNVDRSRRRVQAAFAKRGAQASLFADLGL